MIGAEMREYPLDESSVHDASGVRRWRHMRSPVRRMIVVLVILFAQPVAQGIYFYLHFLPDASGAMTLLQMIAFGTGATVFPLAVWLCARQTRDRLWLFTLCAVLYLAAYVYSHALSITVIDSLERGRFVLPLAGWHLNHYSAAPSFLLGLFYLGLILFPITLSCQCLLVDEGERDVKQRKFSLRGMLAYTGVIATVMASPALFPSDWAPERNPGTSTSLNPIAEWFHAYGVVLLPQAAAGMVMLFGLSRRWPAAISLLVVGCVINVAGVFASVAAVESLGHDMGMNLYAGPPTRVTGYVLGTALANWLALALARVLGVRPVFFGKDHAKARYRI